MSRSFLQLMTSVDGKEFEVIEKVDNLDCLPFSAPDRLEVTVSTLIIFLTLLCMFQYNALRLFAS